MMKNKILSFTNKIFRDELNINVLITENSRLSELGVDSIGFMILIVYLENEFGVEIDIEKILENQYEEITIGHLINNVIWVKYNAQ